MTPHPNIWKFIEKIKNEEETSVWTDFERLEKDVLMRVSRNKQAIERDLSIEKAKTSYLDPNSDFYMNLDVLISNLADKIHDYSKDK